jgi:ABC-2 type transport system ATP-binding protein
VVVAWGLHKRYGSHVAVDGVSFAVSRGEVFGILGPNGAGKSTTLEILEGLRVPDEGTASIEGLDVRRQPRAVHARIGVQLQSTTLFPELSAADNLALLASLYQHPLPVTQVLAEVGLADRARSPLGTLSGGQQQRIALAAALINDPAVVFLDEPTTGLDPQARRAIWALIAGLRQQGKTVVLTTHYMEEAETLCDRIAIMDGGRIVAVDTPAGLIGRFGGGHAITCAFGGPVDPAALEALPGVGGVSLLDGHAGSFSLLTADLERTMLGLLQLAQGAGVTLADLRVHRPGLEDVFLSLTGRTLRD